MTQLLTESEIQTQLEQLSDWQLQDNTIYITKTFKNFIAAIEFINKLVEPAEQAAHHPDIAISYNKVTISLTTHDAGGLTNKDFNLAKVISAIS